LLKPEANLPGEWDTQEMLTKPAHSQIAEQDGITLLFIVDTSKTDLSSVVDKINSFQGWKTTPARFGHTQRTYPLKSPG
jgi:hypothetical protein